MVVHTVPRKTPPLISQTRDEAWGMNSATVTDARADTSAGPRHQIYISLLYDSISPQLQPQHSSSFSKHFWLFSDELWLTRWSHYSSSYFTGFLLSRPARSWNSVDIFGCEPVYCQNALIFAVTYRLKKTLIDVGIDRHRLSYMWRTWLFSYYTCVLHL